MKVYLGNAFSLQMIQTPATVRVVDVQPDQVPEQAISVIGHADTANVVGTILGRTIEANRQSIQLQQGDKLFVAQYTGPRLPEGATQLPEGASIKFLLVTTTQG